MLVFLELFENIIFEGSISWNMQGLNFACTTRWNVKHESFVKVEHFLGSFHLLILMHLWQRIFPLDLGVSRLTKMRTDSSWIQDCILLLWDKGTSWNLTLIRLPKVYLSSALFLETFLAKSKPIVVGKHRLQFYSDGFALKHRKSIITHFLVYFILSRTNFFSINNIYKRRLIKRKNDNDQT